MDEPGPELEAGRQAVVPFQFHCHRCGNCCSAGNGYVWVGDEEITRLAARVGLGRAAFETAHVRTVSDPASGELRKSLREEENGRCQLLEGTNQCSVYSDRPQHCRTFPYWDSVLNSPAGFERARTICPGIAVEPEPATKQVAFAALAKLYETVDAFVEKAASVCIGRGVCCHFEQAGHELFATALEADYAQEQHPDADPVAIAGRCPYHVEGRCTARAGRPLGCRTYFCDRRTSSVLAEAHEHFLRELRKIERDTGYPAAYGRFPALLAARGVPRQPSDAAPTP